VSSYYGVVFPEFWTGPTGKAIRAEGKDAVILALYLMTCRYATMIGVFRLLVDDVKAETGIGMKGLVGAFATLQRLEFADYDATTQHVWVREMAKFRMHLYKKSPLEPTTFASRERRTSTTGSRQPVPRRVLRPLRD
jgi:hypothetical protein